MYYLLGESIYGIYLLGEDAVTPTAVFLLGGGNGGVTGTSGSGSEPILLMSFIELDFVLLLIELVSFREVERSSMWSTALHLGNRHSFSSCISNDVIFYGLLKRWRDFSNTVDGP